MKKLLALVLALVMTMSLVTISNAAFKDANSIDYKEAVEVMNKVGVLIGDDKGNFNAKDTLTRGQAAKIIAYLDLGGKTADAIKGTGAVFTDVKATDWFAGFVEYCAGAGYVAGVGDKKFAPNENVTGVQFAKMLLCALGYSAEIEGYTGADYTIAIARDANKNDLYKDLSIAASANLTREQAAQMAFNALKATVVEYKGGTSVTTGDGTKVVINAQREDVSFRAYDFDTTGTATDATQQLCEKLYKDELTLTSDVDNMKRDAHKWTYKGTESAKYANKADYTEVVAKKDKTVATYISSVMNKDFTYASASTVYLNGGSALANTTALQLGDKIEVFMSSSNASQVTKVVVTRYTNVAEVSGDIVTKTEDGAEKIKVPGIVNSWTAVKNVIGYEGLAKNDVVAYFTAGSNYYLTKTTAVEGKLTEIKGSGVAAKYVVGGTEYLANQSVYAGATHFNDTYKYFLDDNGFVVYEKLVEAEKSDYVILQEIKAVAGGEVGSTNYASARLVKTDGTTSIVKVSSVKIDSTTYKGATLVTSSSTIATEVNNVQGRLFFTYTVDTDGKYELTKADYDTTSGSDKNVAFTTATTPTNNNIQNKAAKFASANYVVDDKTVFVVAKNGATGNDDNTSYVVYTGKNEVANIDTVTVGAVVTDKNNIAKFVFVGNYSGTPVSSSKGIMFLKDSYKSMITEKINGSDVTYYTYDVVSDTTLTTVKMKASYTGTIVVGDIFNATYDSNGMITGITASNTNRETGGTSYKLTNGTLVVAGTASGAFTCADDAKVIVKNSDGDISETTAGAYTYTSATTNVSVVVVKTNSSDGIVKYVFVTESDI